MIEEGMMDEREVNKPLTMKDTFKETDFYKSGLVYLNERGRNDYEYVRSFSDIGVTKKNYEHILASGRGLTGALLTGNGDVGGVAESGRKRCQSKRNVPAHCL
ncbi:MAG: hypothetical protein JKP90_00080 [Desulfofustis sp. PB-SRB1]|nr:hypothetical protein [Desulfofustis sp. PB-SRB1]